MYAIRSYYEFGDRRDCDRLVDRIRGRIGDPKDQRKIADSVKLRTDYLLTQVTYEEEAATVPQSEALASIPPQVPGASGGAPLNRASDSPIV